MIIDVATILWKPWRPFFCGRLLVIQFFNFPVDVESQTKETTALFWGKALIKVIKRRIKTVFNKNNGDDKSINLGLKCFGISPTWFQGVWLIFKDSAYYR